MIKYIFADICMCIIIILLPCYSISQENLRCYSIDELNTSIEKNPNKVYGIKLTGANLNKFPCQILKCPNLENLYLNNNPITGLPKEISVLKKLKHLNLSNTAIKEIPETIGELINITTLDLSHTKITNLPNSIHLLKSIKELDVSFTMLNKLPPQIGLLTNLSSLNLSHTFVESIPGSISQLTELTDLNISYAPIKKIPGSIGLMTGLTRLNASFTQISELPDSIYNLKRLEIINLKGTTLETIPGSINKLWALKELELSNTKLKYLPESVGKLTKLEKLYIDSCRLVTLPLSLAKSNSLKEFSALGNPIEYLPVIDTIENLNEAYKHVWNYYNLYLKTQDIEKNLDKLKESHVKLKSSSEYLTKNNANLKNENSNYKYANTLLQEYNNTINIKKDSLMHKAASLKDSVIRIESDYNKLHIQQNKLTKNVDSLSLTKDKLEKTIFRLKDKNQLYIFILSFLILVIPFTIIYLFIQKKKKKAIEKAHRELKAAQNQLIQAERSIALSEMAIGLAHDLKHPVGNAILGSESIKEFSKQIFDLIKQVKSKDFELKEDMQELGNAVSKISSGLYNEMKMLGEWLNNFHEISTDHVSNKEKSIDIERYIQKFISAIKLKLDKYEIQTSIGVNEKIYLYILPAYISRILQNLVNNSIEHGFGLGFDNAKPKKINIEVCKTNEQYVQINYSDNGLGVAEENFPKIFDPYFTTRNGMGGTGLHTVKNIVEQSLSGTLECESSSGNGFSLIIKFPAQFNISIKEQ